MPRRKVSSVPDFWMASAKANAAMWVTLSHRVPMLLTGQASAAEQTRMVSEKLAAMAASSQAAALAFGRLAMQTPTANPFAIAQAATEIAAAAARPFHTRVNANAKRLSRPKTKG